MTTTKQEAHIDINNPSDLETYECPCGDARCHPNVCITEEEAELQEREKCVVVAYVGTYKEITLYMEPGEDAMTVAKALSIQMNCYVSVSMYARIRRSFTKGLVTHNEPNLEQFYEEVDDTMAHNWSCCGQVTD